MLLGWFQLNRWTPVVLPRDNARTAWFAAFGDTRPPASSPRLKHWQEARLRIARIQVREVTHNVEQFVIARDACPTLEQLVNEEYLRQLPKDPWGSPLVLRCPGQWD
jgi:hypothetical protein